MPVLVTTYGLQKNTCSGNIRNVVVMDDLFSKSTPTQSTGKSIVFQRIAFSGTSNLMVHMNEPNRFIYNDLKPKHKVALALKLNHYVIGKVTLMDITLLTAVFLGVVAALTKGTSLAPVAVLAITTGLCVVIELVRIKTRKVKMLQYTLQKSQQAERLLGQYMTYCDRYGSEEEMAKARNIMEMLRQANEELIRRTEE